MTIPSDPKAGGLVPPVPPTELRGRTLTAARSAFGREPAPDLWTRLWQSVPARFAWAASVAVLLFGHVVMGDLTPSGVSKPVHPIRAGHEIQDDLAALVRLERITVSLPDRMIGVGLGEPHGGLSSESEDLS